MVGRPWKALTWPGDRTERKLANLGSKRGARGFKFTIIKFSFCERGEKNRERSWEVFTVGVRTSDILAGTFYTG